MKISGKERALPKENITLNISILKSGIFKLRILLDESLSLIKSYNYDLKPYYYSKKKIEFEISHFQYKNHLTLGFSSEKSEENKDYVTIQIEALDVRNEIKEMSKFDIFILKPEITVNMTSKREKENEINIKIEKKNSEVGAYFKGFAFDVKDYHTNKDVKFKINHFTEDEYIDQLDIIPIIFDIDTAIKNILIMGNKPVKLIIYAKYNDRLGNEYESNKASIIMEPISEEVEENEITTIPIFDTVGFDFLPLEAAMV